MQFCYLELDWEILGCLAYLKDPINEEKMLFTEYQNSTSFGSYCRSKIEILVGFLIDFDRKSQFWKISLKTYQIWQRLLK